MNCKGDATGSATADGANGTGPYTYSWNTVPVQNTATATGLIAGTYSVTVTDANLCTTNKSVTINEPLIALSATTTQVNVLCFGGNTGSATVYPESGMGGYTFFWDDGAGQITATATSLIGGTYHVTVTDANQCTITKTVIITQPASLYSISGTLKYFNAARTRMNDVMLKLWKSNGDSVMSVRSSSNSLFLGDYEFTGLCAGTYTITVTDNKKPVGYINSTDAGAVNYWSAHWVSIEHAKFLGGDVSNDNFVNSTDAIAIQQYFVYGPYKPVGPGIPPYTKWFTRSEWSYWKAGDNVNSNLDPNRVLTSFDVVVGGSSLINYDLYGICTGDFNGSFIPGSLKSASSTVQLTYDATKKVDSSQDFDLPIRVVNETELGAVSLILEIPSDLVEVKDVYLKGSINKPDFAVNGNLLTIGWNSTTPVNLSTGADMIVLKLRTTANFTEGNSFRLMLAADPLNELADGSTNVIPDAILNTDVMTNGNVGIDEQYGNNGLTLANYPNPFIESTTVLYTLPVDGNVTLEIYDMVGQVVKTLVSKPQTSGNYNLKVDARTMSPGVYMLTLRLNNGKVDMVKTIKFVVNK